MEEQHGFRPGRSTTTCNAVFCNHKFKAFNAHSQIDVIYTDFAKAFDHVDHLSLLSVLKETNFEEPFLSWFCFFVENRKQWIKMHIINSILLSITSGVLQGGQLPPLLFFLFINSINQALKQVQLLAFADDRKLFYHVISLNDCLIFQNDMNNLGSWATKFGLQFNTSKCHSIIVTGRNSLIRFN